MILRRLTTTRPVRPNATLSVVLLAAVVVLFTTTSQAANEDLWRFTVADKEFLGKFSISNLPDLPAAPDNRVADSLAAAKLGHRLFFDARFSSNGSVSCASCHQPDKYFSDGLPVSTGLGKTRRNAPSIAGAIYGEWFYWDGRKDSLWSQALTPFEDQNEQNFSRLEVALTVLTHYADSWVEVFGADPDPANLRSQLIDLPAPASPVGNAQARQNWSTIPTEAQQLINRVFSNAGKALMAYERKLTLVASRFDHFVDALVQQDASATELQAHMSADEVSGMRLFMGIGNCSSCHNGPLFSNQEFHNVGAPEANESDVDLGRYEAIDQLLADEFSCLSKWSDAETESCEEMNYLKRTGPELVGAFKTPSLRNIAETAPYMQQGQFQTLDDVVEHYNKPTPPFYDRKQHPNRPHFDILPLNLNELQKAQLTAFLGTLTSELKDLDQRWWSAPAPETSQ